MPYDPKAFCKSVGPFALFLLFIVGYLLLSVLTAYRTETPPLGDQEFMTRNLWTVAVLILSAVLVWNVLIASWIVWREKIGLMLIVAGVLIAVLVIALGYLFLARTGRVYMGEAGAELIQQLQECTNVPVAIVVGALNWITAAIAAAVVGALGVLMYKGEKHLNAVCERWIVRDTRLLLLSSAALLVAGVVEIAFLYRWAASIHPSVTRVSANVAASTFAIKAGAVYSMMLVMIYAPVFVLHEARVSRIADASASTDREKWLKKHGLQYSLSAILTNLVALASPWLSGLATLFFK